MEKLFSDNLTAEYISNTTNVKEYNQQLQKSAAEVEKLILERRSKGYRYIIIEPQVFINRNVQKDIMEELKSERRKFKAELIAPYDVEIGEMWNLEVIW